MSDKQKAAIALQGWLNEANVEQGPWTDHVVAAIKALMAVPGYLKPGTPVLLGRIDTEGLQAPGLAAAHGLVQEGRRKRARHAFRFDQCQRQRARGDRDPLRPVEASLARNLHRDAHRR